MISPLLANIYLHDVLDVWFEQVVKPCLRGRAFLIRYADDFGVGFVHEEDARRVLDVLPKRFGKYGLTIHTEKTRLVCFTRPTSHPLPQESAAACPTESFDFLGFTHFWGLSKQGKWVVKRKTSGSRLHRAIKKITEWLRRNLHEPIGKQYQALWQKMHGHFLYYGGLIGNLRCQQRFRYEVIREWKKWLSRRDRGRQWTWARMNGILKFLPLPVPRSWVPPCVVKP